MLVKIGSEKKKIGKLPSLSPFSSLPKLKENRRKICALRTPLFMTPLSLLLYWLLENWILYVFDETLDWRRTARLFTITPQNGFLGRSITIWQGSLGCSFVVSFGFCSFHSGNYNTPNPFRSGESPPIGIVFASDSLIVSGPHRPSIFPIFSKSMTFYRIQHF